jgi:hypothetical protein
MASLISSTERANILQTFEDSFDTFARSVTIYKEAQKIPIAPAPPNTNNVFGFGEQQQDAAYTYATPRSQEFPAIIRDADVTSTTTQVGGVPLSPEIISRILNSPISIKVRRDAMLFLEDGPTERIVDNRTGEIYILNGHYCLQSYQGSEYYIYPLRKTQ